MSHHELPHSELVIFHQCDEALLPVLTQSCLERLEHFSDVLLWLLGDPVDGLGIVFNFDNMVTYSAMILPLFLSETLN